MANKRKRGALTELQANHFPPTIPFSKDSQVSTPQAKLASSLTSKRVVTQSGKGKKRKRFVSSQKPTNGRRKPLGLHQEPKNRRTTKPSQVHQTISPHLPNFPLVSPPTSFDSNTPSVTSHPLPLTKHNLRLLNGSMTPTTPDSRGTKRTASGTTKTTLSGKGARLRDFLKINNLFINNKKAEKGYPQILERAEAIVHRDRNSTMKADSEKKLWDTRETYGNGERNEDTFMKHFWGKLIRDEREVEDDDASDLIKPTWKALAWEHSHLDDNWNREFRKGSIPEVDITGDKVWAKLLNTCERVKNPKPDIAYGLSQDAFTDAENRVNTSYFREASISPGILFPGLVVEGKTAGIMEIVECQCARGGSALVNAMRQFRQVSGVSISKPGADLDTFVFSIALVPTLANLSVHWAEITEDGRTRFHMNTVDSYALLKKGQFKELRHDINNVLNWITDDRKIFLKQIIEVITQKILTDGLIPPELMDDDAEDNADEDSISEDEEDDALGVVQGGEGAILLRANEVEEGLELGRGKRRRFPSKR